MRRFLLATVAASAFALAPMLATAQTSPNPAQPDAYQEPATPAVPNTGAPPGAPPAMPPADQSAAPMTPEAAPMQAAPAPAAPATTASACQAQNTTIYFNSGSDDLDDRAETAITQPISAAGCSVREVRIAGFADQRGSDTLNLALSQRRAEAVRDILVAQGITADKIQIEARGEQGATGDDTTDRRAEVQLVFADTAASASLAPSATPYASNAAPAAGVDLGAPTTTAEADAAMTQDMAAAEPAAPVEPSDAPAQSAAQTAEDAMASANAMMAQADAVPETAQTAANVCAAPREIAVDFTGTSNALSAGERTELESAVSAVSACEIQAVTIAAAPEGDARAGAVRDVLVAEGVPAAVISVAEEEAASPAQVAVEMRFAGPSAG